MSVTLWIHASSFPTRVQRPAAVQCVKSVPVSGRRCQPRGNFGKAIIAPGWLRLWYKVFIHCILCGIAILTVPAIIDHQIDILSQIAGERTPLLEILRFSCATRSRSLCLTFHTSIKTEALPHCLIREFAFGLQIPQDWQFPAACKLLVTTLTETTVTMERMSRSGSLEHGS